MKKKNKKGGNLELINKNKELNNLDLNLDNLKNGKYKDEKIILSPFIYKRIDKDLGIEPNRYSIKKKNYNFEFIPYLYKDNVIPLNENYKNKLLIICKNWYSNISVVRSLKQYNYYKLIDQINNDKPFWIPCGRISGKFDYTINNIHIDRMDAYILPRSYGNKILCILYHIIKQLYNDNKDILNITLLKSERESNKQKLAYESMGFEYIRGKNNNITYDMKLNIDIFIKKCNQKFNINTSSIYYYDNNDIKVKVWGLKNKKNINTKKAEKRVKRTKNKRTKNKRTRNKRTKNKREK